DSTGHIDLKIAYQLEPWQSGILYVSLFEVFFHSKDGKSPTVSVFSPIRSVEVILPTFPETTLGESQEVISLEKKTT
ncbi:hypothetical protein ACO1M3_14375, partial [Staphylococcus aureus]